MKLFITLLVLIFPLKGFSPQEGGGGNVCYSNGELVLLDEFYVDSGIVIPGNMSNPDISPVYRPYQDEKVMDFTQMSHAPIMENIFSWYGRILDKDVFRELQDMFLTLDTVHLKKDHFMWAWSPDGHHRIACAKSFMRALIVSNREGITILSIKDWNNLYPLRKQIVMFHETLRLAQLHTNWFKDILDDELSAFTMMMYHGASRDMINHPRWNEIVAALKADLYTSLSLEEINLSIASARIEIESALSKGDAKLAVTKVGHLATLLKQRDIKEGREPGYHFSQELKKLRSESRYQKITLPSLRDLREI